MEGFWSLLDLGFVLIGASRKRSCRSASRSFGSFTTLENEGKHCSIRSLSDFWHDLPGTPDDPHLFSPGTR